LSGHCAPVTIQTELIEARIHPDDPQYLWRRADGVDVASSWPDRKASDCTLMDVNGRQHITNYREISNLMAERAGFEPNFSTKSIN
jgi:hypothetical protein